jgi:hypothetical protein
VTSAFHICSQRFVYLPMAAEFLENWLLQNTRVFSFFHVTQLCSSLSWMSVKEERQ